MADLLKNMYNPDFFNEISPILKSEIDRYDHQEFLQRIFSHEWKSMELKQRVRHVSITLDTFLNGDTKDRLEKITAIANAFRGRNDIEQSFIFMFLPDYIEVFGLEHPQESLKAMQVVTQLVSCEFAVRPFLNAYYTTTISKLVEWAEHANPTVRRLASEGSRSRLPWGKSVPQLKRDPLTVLKILIKLKEDPSEYVRRSVANNLNDMSRDHTDLVLKVLKTWSGKDSYTDSIIRHASRTLLRMGNTNALQLQGINVKSRGHIERFKVIKKRVKVGGNLAFEVDFENQERKDSKFRIDYSIGFVTSTGKISTKVFKLIERSFSTGEKLCIRKSQSFKDLTIRRHYPGEHIIAILVNGRRIAQEKFIVFN